MTVHDPAVLDFHDPVSAERRLRADADRAAMQTVMRAAAAEQGDDSRWFIAITGPNQTVTALKALKAAGVDAWTPVEKRKMRTPKTSRHFTVRAAVWPGYVFVHIRPQITAIHGVESFDQVRGMVARGPKRLVVPSKIVKELRVFFNMTPKQRRLIATAVKRGDRVYLPGTAFAEMPGVITRVDDARKLVDVEIALFGGTTCVKAVGLDAVRRLD